MRQRTQLINAIRGHLTEYGWIAPKGPSHVTMLVDLLEEEEVESSLPEAACAMFQMMSDLLAGLVGRIADLDKEIARRARENEVSRRLMTVPGVGPISTTAIATLAPPAETLSRAATSRAWLGLTPLQRFTGGKQKLGVTSKMGERTLRRLLIIGRALSCNRRANAARQGLRGSNRCWLASRACCNHRARQQDGADRLGATYKAGKLQSSGRCQGVSLADLRSSQV